MMKSNKLALAISSILAIALPIHAQETIPDSFPVKEDTPNINEIINSAQYSDAFDGLQDRWSTSAQAAVRSNKFIYDKRLTRNQPSGISQIVFMDENSHLINSTIDQVQVTLGSAFTDSDTSTAIGTTIKGGDNGNGYLLLYSGTKAYDTVVENKGSITLSSGSQAYNTQVKLGGKQTLGNNSYAQANIIDGGVQEISVVAKNAIAEDTIVINGGQQIIYAGTAKNSHIGAGSYQLASGLAQGTKLYDGGYQLVYSGSSESNIAAQDTIIYFGGTQRIQQGIADNSTIYGEQIITNKDGKWRDGVWVESTGTRGDSPTATNTKVETQGIQRIQKNGTAKDTTLNGGTQYIEAYGHAFNTTIDGGSQIVKAYGHTEGSTIKNGGSSLIEFGGYSFGTIDVQNGSLSMQGGDYHDWTKLLGKGAYAYKVVLNGNDANLYIQHNDNTSESTVTIKDLALHDGNVIFGSQDSRDVGKYSRLELTNLSGSGIIAMNTNINKQVSDFLYVENKIADTDKFKVSVKDSGTDVSDKEQHIITAGSKSLDDAFTLLESNRFADAGAYMAKYDLEHRTNDVTDQEEWYLTSSRAGPTTPTTDAVLAMSNVTPSIWDAELFTLRQRLGELDNSDSQNGVWGRFITSRYEVDHDIGAAYKQDMNGFIFGADRAVMQENGVLHIGAMAGYSRSDIDFKRGGSGDVDSYTLATYATYIANSGFYIDGVIKYNYFDNKTNAISTNGDHVSGKYHLSGLGLSFEVGKQYEIDSLFTAPYVLVSGFYAGSTDYTLSNNMQADVDNASSFKTEIGNVIGYNLKFSQGYFKPYLKLAANYEFVDNNKVYINHENSFNNDMSGASIKVGIGATSQFSDRFSAYTEINYMKGSDISMPYSANIGIRYTF